MKSKLLSNFLNINLLSSLQAFLHRIRQNAVDKAEKYITEENVKVFLLSSLFCW